jgi:hypothetical protein
VALEAGWLKLEHRERARLLQLLLPALFAAVMGLVLEFTSELALP